MVNLPLMMWIVFSVAYVTGRAYQQEAGALLVLLLPLYWITKLPSARICDGYFGAWLLIMVAWVLWMVSLQLGLPTALMSGWWRIVEKSAGIMAVLTLVVLRPEPKQFITLLGASSALTVSLTCAITLYVGQFGQPEAAGYGFGHINILMCTVDPVLCAWSALIIYEGSQNNRWPDKSTWAVWFVGVISLLSLTVTTGRRGVSLAIALIVLWFVGAWLWRKSKRLTIWVLIIGAIAALFLAINLSLLWNISVSTVSGRNERFGQYLAAIEGIRQSFPWGFGYYGALHLQELPSESARHAMALGLWGLHVHNEFLDTCLDGGPVALIFLLILMCMTLFRVMNIRDRGIRFSFQAMGIAIFVHMMTDNTYGGTYGQIWMGIALGMMWSVPVTGLACPVIKIIPPIRFICWPLTVISVWGATKLIYPVVMHREATEAVQYRCLQQSLEPTITFLLTHQLLAPIKTSESEKFRVNIIRESTGKIGWTNITTHQALTEIISWKERSVQGVEAFMRFLHFMPFEVSIYQAFVNYLNQDKKLIAHVSPEIQRRLMYLTGNPNLPKPNVDVEPDNMDAAIDLYAALTWHIINGTSWNDLSRPMEKLSARYGNIGNVAQFILKCVAIAPPKTFPWIIEQSDKLGRSLVNNPSKTTQILREVTLPKQATALVPFLRLCYPQPFIDQHRHTVVVSDQGTQEQMEAAIDFYCEVVRITTLFQQQETTTQ
jgi:O-antigen ligase